MGFRRARGDARDGERRGIRPQPPFFVAGTLFRSVLSVFRSVSEIPFRFRSAAESLLAGNDPRLGREGEGGEGLARGRGARRASRPRRGARGLGVSLVWPREEDVRDRVLLTAETRNEVEVAFKRKEYLCAVTEDCLSPASVFLTKLAGH